jgi:hypothetical protein
MTASEVNRAPNGPKFSHQIGINLAANLAEIRPPNRLKFGNQIGIDQVEVFFK